ncbi:MAG TPA: hypothetical protein VMU81_27885 [Acetobacteraceae bacterium]|nr:hypothetical protein [Acetobacteraceae bacterium]
MGHSPRFTTGPDGQPRVYIETQADLAAAIVLTQQAGAIGQAHLMRALAAGRIAYQSLLPETSTSQFKAFMRAVSHRPAVVLIGDDSDLPQGPDGWSQARRAIRWAKAIIVHAAGAELEHYEAAVTAAQTVRRTLIIECGSLHLPAWISAVRAAPHSPSTLVIQPRGGVHPVPAARETLQ